jgi:alkyl hydroperoxide reductase subunit AhpF
MQKVLHQDSMFSPFDRTLTQEMVHPVVLRLYVRKSGWLTDVLSGRRLHTPSPDAYVSDLAQMSPLIRYEIRDAARHGVSHSPTWVVNGDKKQLSLCFLGTPTGHELNSFVHAIVAASKADSGLDDELRTQLARLRRPIDIKVFTHPWCPFCPSLTNLAYRFAVENPMIAVKTIDASAFPRLAKCYGVSAFPTVVINDEKAFSGPKTARNFAQEILRRGQLTPSQT